MNFQAGRTKKGLPAFWEKRDTSMFLTMVELICDAQFQPKKAVFINNKSSIPNNFHAVFIPKEGEFICKLIRNERKDTLQFGIYMIISVEDTDKRLFLKTETIIETDNEDDIYEQLGEAVRPFINACIDNLDTKNIVSNYSQPIDEKAAKALDEANKKK